MERVVGIEPTSLAWKAKVIPLYDTRNGGADKNRTCYLIRARDALSQMSYSPTYCPHPNVSYLIIFQILPSSLYFIRIMFPCLSQ